MGGERQQRRTRSRGRILILDPLDAPVAALFHQVGLIRTDTPEQMFHDATLTVAQPLLNGSRVGIVTNA